MVFIAIRKGKSNRVVFVFNTSIFLLNKLTVSQSLQLKHFQSEFIMTRLI